MGKEETNFNFTVDFTARKKQVLMDNSVPKKLYKYFSKKAIDDWLFPKPSLRYTPPYLLNDPFEVLPALELRISEIELVDKIKCVEPEATDDEVEQILSRVEKYRPFFNYKYYKKFWINNNVGILSMTANPVSAQMWAYYASDNSGAVLEIDITNNVICSLFLCSPFKKVQYKEKRPVDTTQSTKKTGKSLYKEIQTWLFTKSLEWKHEDEYRSVTFFANSFKQSNGLVGTFFIPPNAVTAVYVGIRTSGSTLERIIAYCRQHNIYCGRIEHDVMDYKLHLPNQNEPLSDPLL